MPADIDGPFGLKSLADALQDRDAMFRLTVTEAVEELGRLRVEVRRIRKVCRAAAKVFGSQQIDRDNITERDGVEFDMICRLVHAGRGHRRSGGA